MDIFEELLDKLVTGAFTQYQAAQNIIAYRLGQNSSYTIRVADENLDNLTDKSSEIMPSKASKGSDKMALLNIKGLILSQAPRKDGRYMGRYLMDGKYQYFYAKTYNDLESIALKFVKNGKKIKQSSMTFKQWAERWMEMYHKKKTSEQVYKNNTNIFKNHILPRLANKILNRLSALEVQETINACAFSRQRQIMANLLISCLNKAFQLDILKKDITKAIEKPSHESKDGVPLTKAQEQMLLKQLAGHKLENYIILLLNTGLRRNEALGLQWRHFDFKNNTILIEQQVNLDSEITRKLKTKTSKRTLKMFPTIKRIFEPLSHLKKPNERLFTFAPEWVSKTFKDICAEIGLKNYSIKGNRTTFATRCAELGIADKVVQTWLGHSKLDTTVNIYQKTTDEFVEQEFKKILDKFDTDFDTDL